MGGWLNGLLGWAIGGIDDLWKKAVAVFQAIYSYVNGWFNSIIGDINAAYQWTWNLIQVTEKYAYSIYTAVTSWAVNQFNSIVAYISRLYDQAISYAQSIAAWATGWINRIYSDVTGWINGLERWVINSIWNPLYNLISGALQWIGTSGAWVLYLLTHPDQLALILGRYILAAWLGLGRKYAGPIGRWMVHSLMSMSGEIAGVLEDFIAGIL